MRTRRTSIVIILAAMAALALVGGTWALSGTARPNVLPGQVVAADVTSGAKLSGAAQLGAASYPPGLQDLPGEITRFALDPSDDALWFATITPTGQNALYRYDPKTATSASFTLPADPGGGLFVGIAASADALWVGWDQTLVRFDKAAKATQRFAIPAPARPLPGEGKWIRDLALTSDGRVWLTVQHAASMFAFDPASHAFTEQELTGFGAADRIALGTNGVLWLTLARDSATAQEFTKIALFNPTSGTTRVIAEKASSIAADRDGSVLLGGNPNGITRISTAGSVVERFAGSHPALATDIILALGQGHVATNDRRANAIDTFDPSTRSWTRHQLTTKVGTIAPPQGYTGPTQQEIVNEITDMHVDSTGAIWAVDPSYRRFVKITP